MILPSDEPTLHSGTLAQAYVHRVLPRMRFVSSVLRKICRASPYRLSLQPASPARADRPSPETQTSAPPMRPAQRTGKSIMATPTPWGNEFLVNTIVTARQHAPAIARLANGGFVATWADESAQFQHPDIHAQVFGADGSKLGAEFLVNTTTSDNQVYAQATGLAD